MTVSKPTYRIESARRKARLRLAGFASVVVFLSGCSGNSFVARQFDDFTAHYNKFYNANRTYREQERKLQTGDVKIDADRFLSTFDVPVQRGRSAEFEKVITKSADLLRNHPRSKWVDDALMLIGKSYFYQSNFVGAEQKFNEIINLDGKLKDEAKFWLARTLVAGQSAAAAEEIIGAALADDDLRKEWRSRFLLLRGDLRTEVGLWELAIEDVEEGLKHVDDGDIAARAYFLLGQLHEQEGQFEEAVRAYNRAQSKKPLYELSYAAMVDEIRVLGMHVDPDAALGKLERAMRENKHYQNRYHLQYLHARILAAAGDPLASRSRFAEQLYPSDPTRKTNLRGEVHYRLAELYRDYLSDFYAAGVHFDTASSVLRNPPAQNEQFTPDAITDAKEMAATFRDYRQTLDQVSRMDSLLYLGSLDKAAFDSAVAVVRVQLAEEAARIQAELERRRTESRFRQAASGTDSRIPITDQAAGSSGTAAFGFLNHKDLQRVQEAYLSFKEVWGDRPLVPGWRREEAVALAQRQTQSGETIAGESNEEAGPVNEVRFLPPVDVSEVPRDSLSQARMRAERAQARYRLANVLFLSIGLPDSAAKWYRKVIDEDTGDPVANRALYALAEVHEALGDNAASMRTLERVIERYPESEFANRARARLGLSVETDVAATDTLEITTNRYEDAYLIWKHGDYRNAIDAMVRIAADFPDHEAAGKALLAAARIFLEKAHREGDDFYGVIPIGDSVFTDEEVLAAVVVAAPPLTASDDSSAILLPADSTGVLSPPDDATASLLPDSSASLLPDVTRVDTIGVAAADVPEVAADTSDVSLEQLIPASEASSGEVVDGEVAAKRATGDREGEQLVLMDSRQSKRPDRLTSRADSNLAGDTVVDDMVGARRTGPLGERNSGTVDIPPDTNAIAVRDPELSVADTTASAPVEHEAVYAPTDSAGVSKALPARADTAAPAPPKVPEIEWTEPEYFVKDLIPVPMTLHSLYGSVAAHFGGTPYGKRAVELRQGLEAARMALALAELDAANNEVNAEQEAVERAEPDDAGADPETLEPSFEAPDLTPAAPDSSIAAPPESAAQSTPLGEP